MDDVHVEMVLEMDRMCVCVCVCVCVNLLKNLRLQF